MVYSLEERIEIIFIYGAQNQSAYRTAAEFRVRHPDKNLSHTHVNNIVAKFRETGSVKNKKRDQPRILAENAQIEVLGQFVISPSISLRQVARETGLSKNSVWRVLKKHKFHPYKMKALQALYDEDPDRRVEFCEVITARINEDPTLIKNICFSDECTFFLNGQVNKQNCRYWSDNNPHIFVEKDNQHPQKLNVWAGILGNKIIGPIFIEGNLTGDIYLNLLEETIDVLITEELENQRDRDGNPMLSEENLHFKQDGAPPHYALPVINWLNLRFPGKWIGRRGPLEWPPRSPDLTPLDFYLWGYIKYVVYQTPPESLEDLRHRIVEACRNITPETLEKVRQEFENRLYYCLQNNGEHFEHLIN